MECRIEPKIGVVIVAGGKGVRMGGDMPKQFRILGQSPVLAHSINAMSTALKPTEIVVVLPKEHIEFWGNLSARFEVAKHKTIEGGAERFHSVKAGIEALSEQIDIIAVHDGVRPLCSEEVAKRCADEAAKFGAAIPAIAISDSIRIVEGDDSKALDRSSLRAIQTPQIFDTLVLKRAYKQEYSSEFTDDASVVEASGQRVELCQGEKKNIKITTSEDLIYAQMILDSQNERAEEL
ncbi:MAG: 2-C-methyl-D-erythritol 4-phosphate cytidylyltransferase [Rikenellaceae bacterium]